ncbi:MAG: O-antigen ligase family protein [Paludibacter sp.]|nr:O-antigen ligase family protein [Paludibacter sp.]
MIIIFSLLICTSIYFFSKDNLLAGLAVLVVPVPVYFLYMVFKYPRIGFISVLFCNYFAVGLSRYIPAPVGLTVDATLVLTLIAVIFSQFNTTVLWRNAAKDYTIWAIVWFVLTFMQLFNPEAVSREAWFYAMRGQALYVFFTVPLVYLIFNKPRDMDLFIKLCAWFTLLAVLKGLVQKFIGVDHWEQQWLNMPGNRTTHILFGRLRVFSFYSDAGTFGGSMGYFGVLYIILGIHETLKKRKYFYFFVGIMSLYAMLISGTRSAIAVPLTGFVVYTLLTKRLKIMLTVGFAVFAIIFFLKYTTIGQDNYDIRRMRSAFSENNASFNVRVENRKLIADYLKTRPFGGGVGASGNWADRFSPGTFLADTPTDGWYIQIWAEQGIVGLLVYLSLLLYFTLKSIYLILFKLKSAENRYKAIAFTSGMCGLLVSSYTAASLGQMPNTIIVFTSLTLISMMPGWEKEKLTNDVIKA